MRPNKVLAEAPHDQSLDVWAIKSIFRCDIKPTLCISRRSGSIGRESLSNSWKTKMRLTEQEKSAILESIHNEDPTAKFFLFDSRVDDARKGGDIDLYVETGLDENILKHKAGIFTRLWERIGVQRIDTILKPRNSPLRAIHREAKVSGVQLWKEIQ